jgi:two-component system chemotaxis sensor kinase CheA
MFCGNTILGDGSVIMILDPNGIARALGTTAAAQLREESPASPSTETEGTTSLLLFRAGSPHPKAVPLALVTRLEEVDARKIELSNGRHMIQYRGHLMPLIAMDENVRVRSEGAQPLLVFSDGARSMALVVDQIIDIIDDKLDIEVAGATPGVIGSAVVKGRATEVVDVAHFLPLAYADWFRRKQQPVQQAPKAVLLVDDSAFFRNMLAPVLQAAGFNVTSAGSGAEALALLDTGQRFDVVITDIEMPEMSGFELTQLLHKHPHGAELPVIGLSSVVSAEAVIRGRQAGLHDFVAKFDRQGLIAALKEQAELGQAA